MADESDEDEDVESGSDAEEGESDAEEKESEDDAGGEGSAESKKDEDAESAAVEDHEPPTRRSPLSFIIDRKNRKIEKLEKGEDGKPVEAEEEDESPLNPEAAKAIDDRVQEGVRKSVGPLMEAFASKEDDADIRSFLADNPEFKKYEKLARRYMEHKAYKEVPINFIFQGLAFKDAEVRGAAKGAAALKKNSGRKISAGGSREVDTGGKQILDLSPTEFKKLSEEVRQGKQIKVK